MKAPGLPWVPSSPGGAVIMPLGSHAGDTTSMPGHRVNILHTMQYRKNISNADTSVMKVCELHGGQKVISRDMRHPEGDITVGIEGSQFYTNPLTPSPCRCSTWVKSPLEHPLRNSRLSLTQAHLTCWCPPSIASAQPRDPVVSRDTLYPDYPSLALPPYLRPWHLMTLISCFCR